MGPADLKKESKVEIHLSAKEHYFARRQKKLLIALIASVLCNLACITFYLYERQDSGAVFLSRCAFAPQAEDQKKSSLLLSSSLQQELEQIRDLDFETLLEFLDDQTPSVDGYKKRDLALALLASLHHFDVEKVIPAPKTKLLVIENPDSDALQIALFPGLSDQEFVSIQKFAAVERAPFTPTGLFCKLQKNPSDATILQAFFRTQEFFLVETLMQRDAPVEKKTCLAILLEGDWATLAAFTKEQKRQADLSTRQKRLFLHKYLQLGSQTAALELARCDPDFVLHSLSDQEVLLCLQAVASDPQLCQKYALAYLKSPRSEAVCSAAHQALATMLGKNIQDCNRDEIVQYFDKTHVLKPLSAKTQELVEIKERRMTTGSAKKDGARSQIAVTAKPKMANASSSTPKTAAAKPVAKKIQSATIRSNSRSEIVYIVQQGDTLWSIAKKFSADMHDIRQMNTLTSDALQPGRTLRVPYRIKR